MMRISFWHVMPVLLLLTIALFSQTLPQPVLMTALQNYEAGRGFEAQGLMSEANAHYNEAIRIAQDEIARNVATSQTYTVLTWALRRQNRHADVMHWGEIGLALNANAHSLVETMGQSLFFMGDHTRSLDYMRRYVNSVPLGGRAPIAYFFQGEIYRIRQQFHSADIAYSTAVYLQPYLPLWWFRLGSVREAAGDFIHAIEAYERSVSLNPNHQEANAGLARLRQQMQMQ
jgi:tetratricopeptide (TPR) repeat protein